MFQPGQKHNRNRHDSTLYTYRMGGIGVGPDGQVNENVSVDIHGNQTVAKTFISRAARSATQRVDYPDSSNDAVSVSVNGLTVSSLSRTGVETTYSYDALGRRTGTTDPRTGETVTHYNDKGQVDYVEDPKGNHVQYTYNALTGRKETYINAMTKTTRYLYNVRVRQLKGNRGRP